MSKYRYDNEIENRREDVEICFEHLREVLEIYMDEYKQSGGDIKGHDIASLIKNIDEQYNFFDKCC